MCIYSASRTCVQGNTFFSQISEIDELTANKRLGKVNRLLSTRGAVSILRQKINAYASDVMVLLLSC